MDRSTLQGEPPYGDWQLESPWPSAAGIEIEHAAAHLLLRNMTVPVDHDSEPSRLRFQTKLRQIVQDVDRNAADLYHFSLRQSAWPRSFVDVSAYGVNRRNCREFVEDFRRANVASMDDTFRSA